MGTDGDNLKLKKVSFRLPSSLVEECEREAESFKIPLSHILRDRFLQKTSSNNFQFDSSKIFQSLQNIENKFSDSFQDHPLLLEILFLFREFLFERNAQVLKRVDEKLDQRFGKERKRIG